MDVVSLAPVPVASLRWRRGQGAWAQAILCKLTLRLAPMEAELAKRHEPIYERDRFADDESRLYAPSDLAPLRRLCDLTLVGEAHVPRGHENDPLALRIKVGPFEKSLTVLPPEGGFTSVPLADLVAEPGNEDPPRYRIDPARAAEGRPRGAGALGPLAASWPARRSLLGALADPSPAQEGGVHSLPAELDLAFFNAAPPDQRLLEILPGAEIALDHLCPGVPELRTRLPNLMPQTFVERRGKRRVEVPMQIDALWIDTTRGLCSVSWRTQVDLDDPDEPGKIWVAVAGAGKRLNAQGLQRLMSSLGGEEPPVIEDDPTNDEGRDPLAVTAAFRMPRKIHDDDDDDLPDSEEDTQTSVIERPAHLFRSRDGRRTLSTEEKAEDTAVGSLGIGDAAPSWLRPASKPETTGPMPIVESGAKSVIDRSGLPFAPPGDAPPATAREGARKPELGGKPPARPPMATVPGIGPRPPVPPSARAPELDPGTPEDTSSLPKPLAERAAAVSFPAPPAPLSMPIAAPSVPAAAPSIVAPPSIAAVPAPPVSRKPPAKREIVQLLWYETEASEQLRRSFAAICDELEFAPLDPRHDLPTKDPKQSREHHLHFGVLSAAPPCDAAGLFEALREAIGETGRFTPPLVAMAGTLKFPFAELAILRATAAALTPLATEDKKLKASLDQVREICDTPLLTGSAESVTGVTEHLRKLYASTRRQVTLDRVDEMVERMLLEERRYQKRRIFGGGFIRALLTPAGGKEEIPAYLPESLADGLPLMQRFEARLLAEAHVRQDQYEKHPHGLKIVTLGRVLDAKALEPGRGAA